MKEVGHHLLPRARTDKIIVRELPDELLVYDLQRDKAHCLNQASAFVWKHCDGQTDVAELTRRLEKWLATAIDEDVVWLALSQLRRLHLLEEGGGLFGIKVSRRDLVRKYIPAALVLPLILSVPSPTSAQAVSGCPPGQAVCGGGCCPAGRVCCNGVCCQQGQACFNGNCIFP